MSGDVLGNFEGNDAVTLDRVRALPDRWRRLRANFVLERDVAETNGQEIQSLMASQKIAGLDACLSDLEGTLK